MLRLTASLSLLFLWICSFAGGTCALRDPQDSVRLSFPLVHSLWVNGGVDYVASSVGDEIREEMLNKNIIKVNTAVPLQFKYSFSLTDPKIPHFLEGGYQGVGVSVLNLGAAQRRGIDKSTDKIGYPVFAYIFQGGPVKRFSDVLRLDYEWNFGASFGWKPYCNANKNFNLTVGSKVNAYLSVGLNLHWQLSPHTSLFGGLAVSHVSNGNTSFPNPGINYFGLRLGMIWTLNPLDRITKPLTPDTTYRKKKLDYDITAWGSPRKRVYKGMEPPVLLPGHYANVGLSFSPMVNLSARWRVGGSLDLQWDRSSDMKRNYIEGSTTNDVHFATPSFWRQVCLGLSAHGELRMPIFAVNLGCGVNLVAPPEHRGTYQNLTLKAYVWENLFLNVGYQIRNFQQQGSLMLGAGITI